MTDKELIIKARAALTSHEMRGTDYRMFFIILLRLQESNGAPVRFTQRKFAAQCGISKITAWRAMDNLIDMGLVKVQNTTGNAERKRYDILGVS